MPPKIPTMGMPTGSFHKLQLVIDSIVRSISAEEINEVLNFPDLIDRLRNAFRSEIVSPVRHHHLIDYGQGERATLLIMPAWSDFASGLHESQGNIGIKLVSVFPNNFKFQKPSILGSYLLLSGETGEPVALLDGPSLTLWRTAAASALACDYLARSDSKKMLMVGAGALAPYLIRAHSSIRQIDEVQIWNRNFDKASKLAEMMHREGFPTNATEEIRSAVSEADIVSCATMSKVPLVQGEWLKAGTHVDLVGAFSKEMRETDDKAVEISKIFVDTREGALKEGGDIVQPIESGVISKEDIVADLFDLCRNNNKGRQNGDQITMFKSVGSALEDFSAAQHIFQLISS